MIAEGFGAAHRAWGVSLTAHVRALPSISPLLVKTPRLWVSCLHQRCERRADRKGKYSI